MRNLNPRVTMIITAVTCYVVNQCGIDINKNTLKTLQAETLIRYSKKLESAVRVSISNPSDKVSIDSLGDEMDKLLDTDDKALNMLKFCLANMSMFKTLS